MTSTTTTTNATSGYLLQSALSGDRSPISPPVTTTLMNGKLNRYHQPTLPPMHQQQHLMDNHQQKNPLSLRNNCQLSSPSMINDHGIQTTERKKTG